MIVPYNNPTQSLQNASIAIAISLKKYLFSREYI